MPHVVYLRHSDKGLSVVKERGMELLLASASFWLAVSFFLFTGLVGWFFRADIGEMLCAYGDKVAKMFFAQERSLNRIKKEIKKAELKLQSLEHQKEEELKYRENKTNEMEEEFANKESALRQYYATQKANNRRLLKRKLAIVYASCTMQKVFEKIEKDLSL